jgi:uncharacterized protein
MNVLLLLVALLGHGFLWAGMINRLHALGLRRWFILGTTVAFLTCTAVIPILLGQACLAHVGTTVVPYPRSVPLLGTSSAERDPPPSRCLEQTVAHAIEQCGLSEQNGFVATYFIVCWAIVPITLVRLVYVRWRQGTPDIVRFHGRRRIPIDIRAAARKPGENRHHWAARLPCNEILRLETTHWAFDVPRLPAALDGLLIAHLSDFHITGFVGKSFFREAVRVANELQPDLTMLTGDMIDATECFDWIPDTLGQLTARHGVYFILGNHDRRVDTDRLRRALEQCGLIDLSVETRQIEINGCPIHLLGNERPWIDRASVCGTASHGRDGRAISIALAHTPDQLAWARANDVDLLLTGHTHGGQIRIPPFGAIFSPTLSGVKHLSGVYHVPPTILHVTRGVSGDIPIRWNCPPEVAHLRLRFHSL